MSSKPVTCKFARRRRIIGEAIGQSSSSCDALHMRLVSFHEAGLLKPGVLVPLDAPEGQHTHVCDLAAAYVADGEPAGTVTMRKVLELGLARARQHAQAGRRLLAMATVKLGPPIADSQKVLCVGMNYYEQCVRYGFSNKRKQPHSLFFARAACPALRSPVLRSLRLLSLPSLQAPASVSAPRARAPTHPQREREKERERERHTHTPHTHTHTHTHNGSLFFVSLCPSSERTAAPKSARPSRRSRSSSASSRRRCAATATQSRTTPR